MTLQQRAPEVCDVSLAAQYRKILVALDRADNSATIFANALNLAHIHQGQLFAFHCISYLPSSHDLLAAGAGLGMYIPDMPTASDLVAQETLDEVAEWLHGWQQRAEDCAVPCTCEHRIGDPGQAICEIARQWGADLVIIGRRGRSGLGEMLLGSVSNHVMHHAPCDVLVMQSPKNED